MISEPTDWHQALARVSGQLVRGEQRVTTHELLTVHLGVSVTVPTCRRRRRVMRELGWHRPEPSRQPWLRMCAIVTGGNVSVRRTAMEDNSPRASAAVVTVGSFPAAVGSSPAALGSVLMSGIMK